MSYLIFMPLWSSPLFMVFKRSNSIKRIVSNLIKQFILKYIKLLDKDLLHSLHKNKSNTAFSISYFSSLPPTPSLPFSAF